MATPYSAALGRAYTLAGRSADAVALLEDTVIGAETYNRANRALWLSFLSDAYLLAGRSSDAAEAARRGIEGARSRQERGEEAWNLRALAEALCADAFRCERGRRPLPRGPGTRRGARHAPARGSLPRSASAKLYRRTGKHQQAREHLTTAMTMYREMDMRFWLNEAEAEMKALE